MRKAVIKDGAVVNVIEAGEGFELPGHVLVTVGEAGTGGKAGIGWTYDGQEFSPPVIPLDERQAALRAAVTTKLEAVLSAGYSHDFGAPHGVRVLQTRNADDRINWLTSQAAYSAAIAGGAGAVEGATFRTADDAEITLSYSDGHGVLLAMAAWGAAAYANSWSLKNAIAAAEDHAALDSIDIEQGWPA